MEVLGDSQRDAFTHGLHLSIVKGTTGLFEALCGASSMNSCSYPSVVVLDNDLHCEEGAAYAECRVDKLEVIKVK